jgi:DNA-binding HxlR family transcriptional regulator
MADADDRAKDASGPLVQGGDDGTDCEGGPDDVDDLLDFLGCFDGGHPATPMLRLLGRSHAVAVLVCLTYDDRAWWRFTEIEEALDVSTNTLSKRLDELAEAGLVRRESYDEIPPHVEYAATEKAADLEPVFLELRDWAERHECIDDPHIAE